MSASNRLVSLEEAVRRFGVPERTLRRRISDGTIAVYRHDRDRRQRHVVDDDVAGLFVPRSDPAQDDRRVSAA